MKHIVLQIRFLNPLYLDLSQIEYIPFDETWFQEGGSVNKPKYNSQELDAETGLYYYNARYYDGEIGRFVTADNVIDGENDTQGWNRYAYVKNNPVNEKDPSGNWNEAQGCMTEHNQGVHHHYDTYSGEVEKGDSLSRIAEKTLQWEKKGQKITSKDVKAKIEQIKKVNGLTSNTIQPGQWIQAGKVSTGTSEDGNQDSVIGPELLVPVGGAAGGTRALASGGARVLAGLKTLRVFLRK